MEALPLAPMLIDGVPKTRAKKRRGPAAPAAAKKRHRKPKRSFDRYIYKVLKSFPDGLGDTGISKKAMAIMNSFVTDMFERLATESGRLSRYNKRHTLSSREMQSAVKLLLPGSLAKHADSEGIKAVTSYNATLL